MNKAERYAVLAMCIAYAIVILDTTVLNVALPTIREDLGATTAQSQWFIDSYVVVLSALLLIGGRLIDWLGVRFAFRAGVVVFMVASAACAFASGPAALMVARSFQGIGGALLVPATLAALRISFSDAARPKALAIVAAVSASPQAFGPTVGGMMVSWAGWRSVFFMNIPLGLAVLFLTGYIGTGMSVPIKRGVASLIGEAALSGLAMGSAAYTIIEVADAHWVPAGIGATITVISCIRIWTLVRSDSFNVVPLSVVGAPGAIPIIFTGTGLFIAYYGGLFAVNLFFQEYRGMSAVAIGLYLIAVGTPVFVLPLVVSRVAKRFSSLRLTLVGSGLSVVGGFAGLTFALCAIDSVWWYIGAACMIGVGLGTCTAAQLTLVMTDAPTSAAGSASAMANSARQFGNLIGVALVGSAGSGIVGFRYAWVTVVAGGLLAVLLTVLSHSQRTRALSTPATARAI